MHLKDELMPKYAELIYNGFWFAPEREMLQAAIDHQPGEGHRPGAGEALQGQRHRSSAATSPYSLYDQDLVTFEEGKVAYDHRDAAGFIKLNALRLRVAAKRDKRVKRLAVQPVERIAVADLAAGRSGPWSPPRRTSGAPRRARRHRRSGRRSSKRTSSLARSAS